MIVSCLGCGAVQDIKENMVFKDKDGEFVTCPSCNGSFDVDFNSEFYYGLNYLKSLSRSELINLMISHDYETGYEEFDDDEIIDILSRIENS